MNIDKFNELADDVRNFNSFEPCYVALTRAQLDMLMERAKDDKDVAKMVTEKQDYDNRISGFLGVPIVEANSNQDAYYQRRGWRRLTYST